MQVGAGSSNWVERVVLVPSLDECDDDRVFPMDMNVIPKDHFRCVAAEFSKLALSSVGPSI